MSAWSRAFHPSFEGRVTVDSVPDDFLLRIERRVTDGLFEPGRRRRAHYRVLSRTGEALEFEAVGRLTAYAIGLNHVWLRQEGRTTIRYTVEFARWNRYAVIHGLVIGAVAAGLGLIPAVRRDMESYPHGALLYWSMVAFWGLAWPWILTALHRPAARAALERILREELRPTPSLRIAS